MAAAAPSGDLQQPRGAQRTAKSRIGLVVAYPWLRDWLSPWPLSRLLSFRSGRTP